MSITGPIPTAVLVGSLLKELARQGVEGVVVYFHRGKGAVDSNNGPALIAKAISKLVNLSDEGVEAAAKAVHVFRLANAETNQVEPEMDKCALCAQSTPWAELPPEMQALHYLIVKISAGAVITESVKSAQPQSPLVAV